MLTDSNFAKTILNGVLFALAKLKKRLSDEISDENSKLEKRLSDEISNVDGKIHTPDYAAEEGQGGYIKNKPTLIGRAGTGEGAELFNSATEASGTNSHAEGYSTIASGKYSHAEGENTKASNEGSHAEGWGTIASGVGSHAEGWNTKASSEGSHAEGHSSIASGYDSHAEGVSSAAYGNYSHAEGRSTRAYGVCQHVQGEFNIEDREGKYAHIVGNGAGNDDRSNAHTLDWEGNAWYAGTVEGTAFILASPNGTRFQITVADDGTLSAAPLA